MSFKDRAVRRATSSAFVEPAFAAVRAARATRHPKTPDWVLISERDDVFVRAILAATLGSDSNVVDVGAARGQFLEEALRLAPGGRHVAFEPRDEAADQLEKRFPQVEVHRAAVAEEAGRATFRLITNLPELSGFSPRPWPHDDVQSTETVVPVVRLDGIIQRPVSVLKIDVEGAEASCMRGADAILRRDRPLLIFEHGTTVPSDWADPSHAEIWDLLAERGYRVFDVRGRGPLSLQEFASASSSGNTWNFVARFSASS